MNEHTTSTVSWSTTHQQIPAGNFFLFCFVCLNSMRVADASAWIWVRVSESVCATDNEVFFIFSSFFPFSFPFLSFFPHVNWLMRISLGRREAAVPIDGRWCFARLPVCTVLHKGGEGERRGGTSTRVGNLCAQVAGEVRSCMMSLDP